MDLEILSKSIIGAAIVVHKELGQGLLESIYEESLCHELSLLGIEYEKQKHLPFISWKQFVFCGDKSVIRADYMIDDHVHNLKTFDGLGLLFSASHNINENGYIRLNNWNEVKLFFEKELENEPAL